MYYYKMLHLDASDIAKINYQLIVQCWEHKTYGRIQEAWLNEFKEPERRAASVLHTKFADWYLRKGPPHVYNCRPTTLELIHRLEAFFGTHF